MPGIRPAAKGKSKRHLLPGWACLAAGDTVTRSTRLAARRPRMACCFVAGAADVV